MRREYSTATSGGGLSTRAVHAGAGERHAGAPVVTPVVASATFHNAPVPTGEVLYTRYGTNPTHRAVADRIAALEGAEAAIVVASGMAATSLALLAALRPGDHVLASRMLYGQTARLLEDELRPYGIESTFVDIDGDWEAAARPETRVVLAEAISNPTLRIVDLRALARLADRIDARLVVDATFATPVNLRPLEHGVHVVVHSATKYLGGHSDIVAGAVAAGAEFVEAVRTKLKAFGPSLDPHGAWLLERGLKTLVVRVERQNANALALARWLERHPAVARVHHPGLESHPDHAGTKALFDGFGGMLAFVVDDDEAAVRVLGRLRLISVAPSLGGVETLASMPRHTSHATLSRADRHALGIADGFVRISVGIEEVDDLRADLERALEPEAA